MSNFRDVDRQTAFLLPPSVDEWLPERHLARFVVEVIDGLDLRAMSGGYRGSGSASYHPRVLLGLLVYGYATGVFSSRKLERASYDSVAFRFIAANDHPDHDTIATFRRRFLKEIEKLFVDVLQLAREMGVLKIGTIGLDGTKIHANASRHSALSHEHAGKIEAQLKAEVAELMAKAEAADVADVPDGMSIPDELARREERLGKIAEARAMLSPPSFSRLFRVLPEPHSLLSSLSSSTPPTSLLPLPQPPFPPLPCPLPSVPIIPSPLAFLLSAPSFCPPLTPFFPFAPLCSALPWPPVPSRPPSFFPRSLPLGAVLLLPVFSAFLLAFHTTDPLCFPVPCRLQAVE